MKHLSTIAVAFLLGTTAFADDFNLYYDATTGTEGNKIDAVENLQKLTFENGTMTIIRKDGTTSTLSVANIQRLFFSTDETVAIEEVKADNTAAKHSGVYDMTGRKIDAQQRLSKGLYIIDGKKIFVKD